MSKSNESIMFKVVIDTNLLINGATDDYNIGNRIIEEVIAGKILAYANRATLRENQLIARTKIKDRDFLEKLEHYFSTVKLVENLDSRLDVVEDSEDNKLVESAVAAVAEYLISSDRHLLTLESYKGIKIVTPETFWSAYEDESGGGWGEWLKNFVN